MGSRQIAPGITLVTVLPTLALFAAALSSPAKTLKDVLTAEHIPVSSFSTRELAMAVQGDSFSTSQQTFLAYSFLVNGGEEIGPLRVVKYDRKTGQLQKSGVLTDKADVCSGSVWGIEKIDDYLLISTSISPSALCLHIVDKELVQTEILYGFGETRVAQDQIVLTEDMIHFAPVHPERLEFADLRSNTTAELYPPNGDALRANMARENAAHMHSAKLCMQMNDPCDPKLFDESISIIKADGHDSFAFIVEQSTDHFLAPNQPPVAMASQSVLYIYRRSDKGWLYCEVRLSSSERAEYSANPIRLQSLQFHDFEGHCTPTLPVVPDLSTATMNPFM